MNSFRFVGKIVKIEEKKDSKFKYIDTKTFDSGWMIKRVKFRMACGDTSEFVEASGGKWRDDGNNVVYTYLIKEGSTSAKDVDKAQVKWTDRFDPKIVERVPKYKRYTVDLASDKIREKLKEEGKEEEANALADKKYTFIAAYDFAAKIEELLTTGAFGNANYVVSGTVDWSYSLKDGKPSYYRSFTPTSIYLASEDEAASAAGKLDFYYIKDDYKGDLLEDGSLPINGYAQYYDSMGKGNYYTPITLFFKNGFEKTEGLSKVLDKETEGTENADVVVLGFNVEFFSGTPKVAITEDDLSDDDKDLIKWGVKTLEEVIKDKGGMMYDSNKIDRIYITGLARGYNAPQNPDVEVDKLEEKPTKDKDGNGKAPAKATTTKAKEKDIDLFDDDDDI